MKSTMKGIALVALAMLFATSANADDGQMFRRNVSKTPDLETDHATMKMMKFYVPAQSSDGTLLGGIEYYDVEGALVETRDFAKPLVALYHDGAVVHVPDTGFPGHGQRDVYSAVSLDDGATWKRRNLSRSGDLSSFRLADGTDYPGDTFRLFGAVAGNRVMVAWASRYCQGASPLYTWETEDQFLLAETYELGTDLTVDGIDYNTYATDLFGVAGTQKSIDFADEDYPTVGEVPYACLWAARGELLLNDENGTYELEWIKAERITSGVRDVHRIEVHAAEGIGFVVTWQEDPDGLRPGKGLGPGAGWSGAIAHQKTDIWYSHLRWDNFDAVCTDDPESGLCTSIDLAEYTGEEQPQAAVPVAMPVRISDNDTCKADIAPDNLGYLPYCYADFDGSGTADLCASSISWTNPGDTTLEVCQAEDGRVSTGQNASTRARVKLQPYTYDKGADLDSADDDLKSAWVMLAYEEMKGLGAELTDPSVPPDEVDPIDIGKDIWYHSFDLFNPDYGAQGAILNQPAVDHETDEFFPIYVDEWGNDYYETEIARRASMIAQPAGKAGDSGVVGLVLFKQGILNQGGPADVLGRFFVKPDGFDPMVDNPYAPENMACEERDEAGVPTPVDLLYSDGSNPNYVLGICPAEAINMSGTTIVSCDGVLGGEACADSFPWDGGGEDETFAKVTEWVQTVENFNDQSWENPYDVAKGHRGYIDGDYIMMMYGWSPNWKATSMGQDAYNLYVRRSFDGGQTWTTTPSDLGGTGTEHCEWYGAGGIEEETCTTYGAGDFEQARNLSQLVGSKLTLLDPRFTSTKGDTDGCVDQAETQCHAPEYDDDIRDPSVFFVTYQTGDNSTVVDGEATPLDMYYSRASVWGDEYDLVEIEDSSGEVVERFDWIENKKNVHSAEAALATNPGGTFLYAIWNQWKEDNQEIPYESDAIFRRLWFDPEIDGSTGGTTGGSGGGAGGGRQP